MSTHSTSHDLSTGTTTGTGRGARADAVTTGARPGAGTSAGGRSQAGPSGEPDLPPRSSWWRDVAVVLERELRPVLRDPFSVVFGLVQPVVFLGLFGPLLAASVEREGLGGTSVWQWFVPGVLVMVTLFGTSTTGSNLQYEMQTGAFERLLVTPVARSAQIVGRALKEVVPLLAQALVVVVVMVPFGFRPHVLGGLVGLALLAVMGVGIGAFSYALALAVRKQEWMFWAVQQTVLFPLLILSGMLLPLDDGPRWMRVAADLNPLAYVVEAERALFDGRLGDPAVPAAALAAVLTAVVGLVVGVRTIARSSD
ncbi:ABC transporter permease [Cellulomonas carbonis]|uniref:Transport permease protein n=1 Tax=Cellulomonas carbonis T26 TaxID=947969 RepID=A0A0A0BS39_9CELL|nr:ABC transporter permease [Cellulomonas carbonis]KGM10497.1 multidrug ABC transporter permease [Cellulomonas carbonis T26]GGC03329.1 transport permease protein [Cellulomonas carbonis]